jgi:LexA-binding, inner membrane-associated putative hydrolase
MVGKEEKSLNFLRLKALQPLRHFALEKCYIFSSAFDVGVILQLTTHAAFAFAVGLVFFGRPDVALLVMFGALVPDLDREYWFVRTRKYQEEQPHRARFHNVFVMAIGYLLSPFFALGIFLHALQDSFTTAKDRGAEWFFPLTRLIKRGTLDTDGNKQPDVEPGKVYFYQEDPTGIIEYADPDLQEPDNQPTPWRRVYGPALNGCLLDRGFLVGSILIAIVWILTPDFSRVAVFKESISFYVPFIAGFAFFAMVYLSGELDRRDRKEPLKVIPKAMIKHRDVFKKPIFAVGVVFLLVWLVLYRQQIWANLESLSANWISLAFGVASVALVSVLVLKLGIAEGKKKGEPVIV